VGKGILVEFDTEAGCVGQVQVAVTDLHRAGEDIGAGAIVVGHVFQDQEVVRGHGEVCVDGRGDRAGRVVWGDGDVVGLGKGGDLLHLQKATADADVGLDDVGAALLEEFAEAEGGVQHLPGGDRYRGMGAEFGKGIDVFGPEWFFQEEGVEWRQGLGQLVRPDGFEDAGMGVEADLDIRSDGVAHGGHAGDGTADHGVPRQALGCRGQG